MIAEVIAIGDELTSGQRIDTNSPWISRALAEIGLPTWFHSTSGDDLGACVDTLKRAFMRADIVIATGGLGPTADDLTRQAIAQAIGVELVLDPPSLAHIERLFKSRRRPMPESNRAQAMLPAGARAIPNTNGTAPGIALDMPRPDQAACRLFALPGVPAELFEMWEASVRPELVAATPTRRRLVERRIKCFGVGESHLEAMLPDLIRRGREPRVGITVHQATITLRITAEGASEEECLAAMAPTIETIHQCLGTLVFGEEDDELEHAVLRLVARRGLSLATAEWGTAGRLARWLCDSGPRVVLDPTLGATGGGAYRGGVVFGGPEALVKWPAALDATERFGATSGEVAAALATQCRDSMGADLAIGVAALPSADLVDGAGEARFGMAIADAAGVVTGELPYGGHPDIRVSRAAKQALNLLRLKLLETGA
jgi:nicotinamide-nucleotide amidase